jgi:DUF4097 and DUF4098 domain-containing protein YvlB
VTDVPVRPVVRVAVSSGTITVVGEDRADVVVDRGHTHVEPDGEVHVRAKASQSVTVRCPRGTDVVAGTSSGSILLEGDLGHVRATASSGRITVDHATAADLRSSSGALEVLWCDGTVRAATTSGRIRVGGAGAVEARVVSGNVDVTAARVMVRGVSATVEAESTGGDVEIGTVSGKVTVRVPPGCRPEVRVRAKRRPDVEVDEGGDLRVDVRTVSGRVRIRAAS